jgi:hypothetical protein
MAQLTPEDEGLLQYLVYLECKIEVIVDILREKGISLSTEEVGSKTHKLHAIQSYPKRHRILNMMKSGKYDF